MSLIARLLRKRISPLSSIVVLLTAVLFFAASYYIKNISAGNAINIVSVSPSPPPSAQYRMNDYSFTHPLLLSDQLQVSTAMVGLKNELEGQIESKKNSGELISASIHIVSLNDDKFICINPSERYNPGSLFKVPVMMAYLRQSEKKYGLLEQKLSLPSSVKIPEQSFTGKSIERNKEYTIRELLYYMIVESDNNATALLNRNVNMNEFNNFFQSIGIQTNRTYDKDFAFTVEEYSRFMRILYNATYLNNEDADYALSLLAQGKFKDGMLKYLPANLKVAHKFGEAGDSTPNGIRQMHESGIIYLQNGPILLDIMTKGRDVHVLANVIADISKLVYERTSGSKF